MTPLNNIYTKIQSFHACLLCQLSFDGTGLQKEESIQRTNIAMTLKKCSILQMPSHNAMFAQFKQQGAKSNS